MASAAQIEANQRNGRRSSGPRTAAGREVTRLNALRHGLTAQQLIIFDETAEDFMAFHDELRAALAPGDAVEEQLAERIVLCAWRLRRAGRADAGIFNAEARHWADERRAGKVSDGTIFRLALTWTPQLTRYEMAIERALQRAAADLERRQARRAGESVPLPVAVDVRIEEGVSTAALADAMLAGGALPPRPEEIDKTNPISPPATEAIADSV